MSSDQLNSLTLPDLWIKEFFIAKTYLELQLNDEALKKYTALSDAGFKDSTYVISQIALAHHYVRGKICLFLQACIDDVTSGGQNLCVLAAS